MPQNCNRLFLRLQHQLQWCMIRRKVNKTAAFEKNNLMKDLRCYYTIYIFVILPVGYSLRVIRRGYNTEYLFFSKHPKQLESYSFGYILSGFYNFFKFLT